MALELLWQENFDASHSNTVDGSTWTFDKGDGTEAGIPGWGNQEREFYTEKNIRVRNGLTIFAHTVAPEDAPNSYYGKAEWLSSKIHTAGKVHFLYGRFDFDAQASEGGGSWPAIWMLGSNLKEVGWPKCGEIDIFEGAGNRPYEIRGTLHGPEYCGNEGITAAINAESHLSSQFHTYSIEWLPSSIAWLVDEEEYFRINKSELIEIGKDWPFNQPFYLIINLAMGGWFAGDIAPGFNECTFNVRSIKFSSIDGVGSVF